jgi:hypothetical protein
MREYDAQRYSTEADISTSLLVITEVMERLEFHCLVCGQVRNSKKALKRHLRFHDHERNEVLRGSNLDDVDSCTMADGKVCSGDVKLLNETSSHAESTCDTGSQVATIPSASADIDCDNVTTPVNGRSGVNNVPTVEHETPYRAAEVPMGITSAKFITVGNARCADIATAVALTAAQEQSNRKRIDEIVAALKLRHLRDRTYLSARTGRVVKDIQRSQSGRECSKDIILGIVVAAKHFAGTLSPRRPAIKRQRVVKTESMRPEFDQVKRKLFADETPPQTFPAVIQESSMVTDVTPKQDNDAAADVTTAANELSVGVMTTLVPGDQSVDVTDQDEQWRADVWRSYGTRVTKPPSPMGYQWSPSIAIGRTSPPPVMSPVANWSSSSDDEPWGPDSPMEPLEFDSQEVVPNWPRFVDSEGRLLVQGSEEWTRRLNIWSQFRTSSFARATRKRRHHCRARKTVRLHYEASMEERSLMTYDWNENRWRPTSLGDVKLPSPFSDGDLHRIRRAILRKRNLPTGCRIQPPRRAKRRCQSPASADILQVTSAQISTACKPSTPEIVLTVSDDEL